MKNLTTTLLLSCSIAVLMNSCAVNKASVSAQQNQIPESKESANTNFVKYKNGTVVYYNSLKLSIGAFKTPHLIANDKIKIYPKEILAYQNDEHYAISQDLIVNGRKSFVAKDALPGFAVRVAKGQLNIYCKKFFNGNAGVNEYFIQSGEDGLILAYTPDLMKAYLKDNYDATVLFEKNKSDLSEKIKDVADLFNTTQLVSKN
jgi:hypothetical protein